MNDISYSDFNNICRMCMLSCDTKFTRDNVISDVFYKLTDIHFDINDELPQHICVKCFNKVNEIHEFALQCKETHSSLLQCLNNFKNPRLKEEQDISEEIYEPVKIEEIIIDQNKIDFIKIEASNSTSEYVIEEVKENVLEDKNNELEENMIPGTSDYKNINFSKDLLKQKPPNIKVENEEESSDNVNLNDSNEDMYSSDFSNSSYIDSSEYDEEISKQTKDKHKCEQKHKNLSSCEGSIKCEKCSKSFLHSSSLKYHMRMHNNERPYKCEQCSKSFIQISDLKIHMRMHNGERPFKCEQCFKSFSQSQNLKSHMRSHSGERPHKCEQCSKTYSLLSDLKIHMRAHSGERPFKCEHCSKSYIRSQHFKRHMLTHSGQCFFKCEQCPKSFTRLSNLKVHMRKHSS